MTDKTIEKRQKLKTLSLSAKEKADFAVSLGDEQYIGLTVNELLKKLIYDTEDKLTFKPYKVWKDEGFTVSKGEKAFLFWGTPLKNSKKKEDSKKKKAKNEEDEEDPTKFFPLSFLFSNLQVSETD